MNTTSPKSGKILMASMIGTMIEYFDFYIYSTAAVLVFPTLFFPMSSPTAATLESLATAEKRVIETDITPEVLGQGGGGVCGNRKPISRRTSVANFAGAQGPWPRAPGHHCHCWSTTPEMCGHVPPFGMCVAGDCRCHCSGVTMVSRGPCPRTLDLSYHEP